MKTIGWMCEGSCAREYSIVRLMEPMNSNARRWRNYLIQFFHEIFVLFFVAIFSSVKLGGSICQDYVALPANLIYPCRDGTIMISDMITSLFIPLEMDDGVDFYGHATNWRKKWEMPTLSLPSGRLMMCRRHNVKTEYVTILCSNVIAPTQKISMNSTLDVQRALHSRTPANGGSYNNNNANTNTNPCGVD